TSNMNASVTSATIRMSRNHLRDAVLVMLRLLVFIELTRSGDVACIAGARPKRNPVTIEIASAKTNTRRSMDIGFACERIRRNQALHPFHHAVAGKNAEKSATNRKKHVFRQELGSQAPPPGAKRSANRDLTLAGYAARQCEIGQVRASDQEHHSCRDH